MNTKKSKNKKPNKSPNPNPQQTTENVKVPEKVDDIPIVEKVESELKIDERVPEITSDVTTTSEIVREVEAESPRKPKRNRGKKKKQDKESETEENQEDNAAQPVLIEEKEAVAEIKASNVELETIIPETQNLTPTARKKKNKNKKAGFQDTIPLEEEKVDETPVAVDISETEMVNVSRDITSEVLVKPIEEVQPAKKKNKKKKRHDSEKSEKAEEISCTAAFQKILNIEDEKSKEVEEKQETLLSILNVEDVSSKITDALEENKEDEMLKLNNDNIKEDVVFKAGSGKNKKKNKKGKTSKIDDEQYVQSRSESQCDIVCEDNPIISIDILKPAADIVTEIIDKNKIPAEGIPETAGIIEETEKYKAKIAKPVDKKGKEKLQLIKEKPPETSNISEVSILQEKENVAEIITEPLDVASQAVVQPKEIPLTKEVKDEAILTSLVELINVPQSSMRKKRRKSPKPLKETQELKKESDEQCISYETEKSTKSKEEYSEPVASEPVITIEKSLTSDQQKEPIILNPVIILKNEPEPVHEILTAISEIKHEVPSVSKSGKKGKKSPKPPTKLEIVETSKPDKERDENVSETKQKLQEHGNDEMTDIFFEMPHMEDIEIRSVKADESEESTCEVMPDTIQYPRPNSQQEADNNNNTVIQEISQTDDTKLAIPIVIPDTPFIQEDTPLSSPGMLSVSIVDAEVSVVKPNEPEKTDLKSKMMEVNQDMEELRLSIEKSLAELTSMEKNEENIEKQYEKQIRSQPKDSQTLDTSVSEINLDSTAVKLEDQITDSSAENKNVTTKIESNPIPETVLSIPLMMPMPTDIIKEVESIEEDKEQKLISSAVIPPPPPMPVYFTEEKLQQMTKENKPTESSVPSNSPPVCPARKDQKGKGKSKKKGKQEAGQTDSQTESTSTNTKEASKEGSKKEHKTEAQEKGKQHSFIIEESNNDAKEPQSKEQPLSHFEPIENFEDAMTSSIDDVNKSFEMIATEAQNLDTHVNPEIKIIAPLEETKIEKKDDKINPVSQPKNLLGHPVIPVRSNKMDYKKEKNKSPNAVLANVKIKDSVQIENKQSKESQTENIQKFMKKKANDESFSTLMNENEEFVYKYSFRKVFLPSVCHVCKKDLKQNRVVCSYCNLLFYCCTKHKDEDWPQHQAFCFAVSTIVHLKEQKHIYEDAKNITGHNYRLLRMQMIVSCEKILKRKLLPWEQEALLYPRMCSDVDCREWRQNKLVDCDGCWQIAYCSSHPDHLPNSHKKWCKSYSLYQKLVCHQQTKGRLEPKMPSGVITKQYQIPETMNEVLASLYKEKIEMNDVEYAALTQLATAPLTAVYSFQMYNNKMNSIYANGTYKKTSFTIHVVGAELQFEADVLNKWELFFLHLRPDIKNLTICLIASNLNPSNLPLDLLGKVRLCEYCRQDKRRLLFSFQDKKSYSDYYKSDDFTTPDMVCMFNPSIQRSSVHNGKDTWPSTINTILKQKIPFIITSYSMEELCRDLGRIKECSQIDFNIISEPKHNTFSSVRPDRNFITDEEMPLLFKNYCFAVICGVF